MSDILIKNMEMPDFGERIIILTSSGYVEDISGSVIQGAEAISIPTPHGKLKDADAIRKDWLENYRHALTRSILDSFDDAPTIIPASKED